MKRSMMLIMEVFLLITGCANRDRLGNVPQGVHVGNAMITYGSHFGYAVSYDDRLKFNEDRDGRMVTLDSSVFNNDSPSHLTFEIQEDAKVHNFTELQFYAEGAEGATKVTEVQLPHTNAVLAEKSGSEKTYYFLCAGTTVVKAALSAISGTIGGRLIEQVLQSVQVDVTPPRVTGIHWEQQSVDVKSSARLKFTAIDEISGISSATLTIKPFESIELGYPLRAQQPFTVEVPIEKSGEQEVSVNFPDLMVPGMYAVTLAVSDKAHNTAQMDQASKIEVVNKGDVDTSGPQVLEVSAPKELKAGELNEIPFKGTDEFAGVQVGKNPKIEVQWRVGKDDNSNGDFLPTEGVEVKKGKNPNEYVVTYYLSQNVETNDCILTRLKIYDNVGNPSELTLNTFLGHTAYHQFSARGPATEIPLQLSRVRGGVRTERGIVENLWLSSDVVSAGSSVDLMVKTKTPLTKKERRIQATMVLLVDGSKYKNAQFMVPFSGDLEDTDELNVYRFELKFSRWIPRGLYGMSYAIVAGIGTLNTFDSFFWTEGGREAHSERLKMPTLTIR